MENEEIKIPSFVNERNRIDNERLRQASTTGKSGKRTGKKVKMTKSKYHKRLGAFFVAGAITASAAIGGGVKAYDSVSDTLAINAMVNEFQSDTINPETHRTDDNKHYFYDYTDIENSMEDDYESYPEAVYLCTEAIGEYQTDKVLQYSNYKSYDNFLKENNYIDKDDFMHKMKKEVLLNKDVEKKTDELDKMQQEREKTSSEQTVVLRGGK